MVLPRVLMLVLLCVCATACRAVGVYEGPVVVPTEIDRIVSAELRRRSLPEAEGCSDAVFLRRVHIDVCGILPTAEEAEAFLADTRPDRRARLVDRLLERPEYADMRALKWGDLLRIKSEFPINLWPNAAQAYHRWVLEAFRSNMPMDRILRELLVSNGSNFRVPPVNFHRAIQGRGPEALARATALTFMGMRTERWTKEQADGLAGFFTTLRYKPTGEWKEEIVFHDPFAPADPARRPVFPDGRPAVLAPGEDPRIQLAEWLLDPREPRFARSLANRVWFWLMGRGIVHEPDDLGAHNPPFSEELLELLTRECVAGGYDLRRLMRVVLVSRTYQRSCIPAPGAEGQGEGFAFYPVRRIEAEVLADLINQATTAGDAYVSAIPEPFTHVPRHQRSALLADGSITGPFLEKFGRSARDTGQETERPEAATPVQRMHLLNSAHIRGKLDGSALLRGVRRMPPERAVRTVYLTLLSRQPSQEELAAARELQAGSGTNASADLAWALINSMEFSWRH